MITELTISHYRSIGEVTIPLGPLNVLIGRNGSGKSNIVDAIGFISDIANEDLDYAVVKRHGIDSIRQWSKTRPFNITIQVKTSSDGGEGFYRIVISSARNTYRIVEETAKWRGKKTYDPESRVATTVQRDQTGSLKVETDYDEDDLNIDDLKSSRIDNNQSVLSHLRGKLYSLSWALGGLAQEVSSFSAFTIFPNTIRSPQTISRATSLEQDGKNIASILKNLPTDSRRRIVKHLRVVMPNLVNIAVRSAAGYYVPVFLVSELGDAQTHELNMSQISDGTLRMLGILSALYQVQSPNKVVIEEPEQMVHPALLIVLRDAVLDFSHRRSRAQVFLTTHSPAMIDLFDVSTIIGVEYDGISTQAGPISDRQKNIVRSGLMTLGDVVLAEGLELA